MSPKYLNSQLWVFAKVSIHESLRTQSNSEYIACYYTCKSVQYGEENLPMKSN